MSFYSMFNYIPLKEKSKQPSIGSWKQFTETRVTPQMIGQWQDEYPKCNWGIVTGAISGIVVLDLDGEEGKKNIQAIAPQGAWDTADFKTPAVKTGNGQHIYFSHPGVKLKNRVGILPGVDFRSDGGYVVAPPSIHENGNSYEWIVSPDEASIKPIPPWLWGLLNEKQAPQGETAPIKNDGDWLAAALQGVSSGQRNDTAAKLAGYFLGKGMSLDAVTVMLKDWNTKNIPPMDAHELDRTIISIYESEAANQETPQFLNDKGRPIINNIVTFLLRNYHFLVASGDSDQSNTERLLIYGDGVYTQNVDRFLGNWLYNNIGAGNNTEANHNRVKKNLLDAFPKKDIVPMSKLQFFEKNKINLKNGVLDIDTGQLIPHSPRFKFLNKMPINYEPGTQCPVWEKFLETTLESKHIPTLQEFIGYCLVPDTRFQKALLLYGTGANGKSIITNTILSLFGRGYTSGVPLDKLQGNKFAAAQILGKLVNISSETVNYSGPELDLFKALVVGDEIVIEEKYQSPMLIKPTARLIFASNHMLKSGDKSDGNYRRWIIIPFEKQFKGKNADIYLQDKINNELPGILNWAIEGLKRLVKQGNFTHIDSAMGELMVAENDTVAMHSMDCLEFTNNDDDRITHQALYNHYKWFCQEELNTPDKYIVGNRNFRKRLAEINPNFQHVRHSQGMVFKGIKIKEEYCHNDLCN